MNSIIRILKLLISLIQHYYIYTFKLKVNEYLDHLKFKTSNKCVAKNYHPKTGTFIKPCTKYTYKLYCEDHAYLLRILCDAYHYLNYHRIIDVPRNVIAEVELSVRIQFCERFAIEMDSGHSKWNEYLRGLLYAESFTKVQRDQQLQHDLFMKQRLYNKVIHEPVCIDALSDSLTRLSLEVGHSYNVASISTQSTTATYDYTWNNNKCSTTRVNQCSKSERYKLSDVTHLNLIPCNKIIERDACYSDDDWSL